MHFPRFPLAKRMFKITRSSKVTEELLAWQRVQLSHYAGWYLDQKYQKVNKDFELTQELAMNITIRARRFTPPQAN